MAGVQVFTDLKMWQEARQWSKQIFQTTKDELFRTGRRLVTQINDSSESAMANIAEGFGRGTQGEFVQFLGYSIGSVNETQSHLCAAYDREYLSKDQFARFFEHGTTIRKMIVKFIQSMVKPGSGVKHMRKVRNWTDENWDRFEKLTGQQRPEVFRKKEDEDE